jgi:hypothetical protein
VRAADFQEPTAKPDGVVNIHFTAPDSIVTYAKKHGFTSPAALARVALNQYMSRHPEKGSGSTRKGSEE